MRAISTFSRDAGTSTFWCRACSALRTLVSISATGSVNLIVCFSSRHPFAPHSAENLQRLRYFLTLLSSCYCHPERRSLPRRISRSTNPEVPYHDDFETPGISPCSASCRKHKRHKPNLRRYARGRPQRLQRLCLRVENLGLGSLLSRAF